MEHNHPMALSAKVKLSISRVPTSFTLLILSSTICQLMLAFQLRSDLAIGFSMFLVLSSHHVEILARVLSPVHLRNLFSCIPRTQCGCCCQTNRSHPLDQPRQIPVSGALLPAPAGRFLPLLGGLVLCFFSLQAQHLSSWVLLNPISSYLTLI